MRKQDLQNAKQFRQALKEDKRYITVNITLAVRFDLSPVELLVYSVVKHATDTMDLGVYSGSVKGICAKINVSLPTARAALDQLVKKGLLDKGVMSRERQRPGAGKSLTETWVWYSAPDLWRDGKTPEEVVETVKVRHAAMDKINEERKKITVPAI